MTASRIISIFSSLLVAALAVASFVVSYDALRSMATSTGAVSEGLAWLWPLLVDGALVVFSLAVVRNSLLGESAIWPMTLVVLFSALSVALNVWHAPGTLPARIIAAIAPVALLLSFETLMTQVKSEAARSDIALSLAQMTGEVSAAQDELGRLILETDTMIARLDTVKAEVDTLRKERRLVVRDARADQFVASDPGDGAAARSFMPGDLGALELANGVRMANKAARQAQVERIKAGEPGVTYGVIAGRLGVSLATIKRDMAEIKERKNGRSQEDVGDAALVSEAAMSIVEN